jgi:predicted transcriptional regulator
MPKWKDEDVATPELIQEYLKEFKEGMNSNTQLLLSEQERLKIQSSLIATEKFCLEMLNKRRSQLYMHDLILMAVGFYGGYLSALDLQARDAKPNTQN